VIIKGTKINNRYSIIRTLGEGGMANVYLAYDTILDRNVAVKVLRGDLATDEKFVRRFQREALSASNLYHPNIVQIYDFDSEDGQYYIVMEYVEGKTLKQLLKRRGSLTITEVIDIMSQVTDGMAHAHDSYIIHRDIKPQNIMILDNGMIKITDFGIAMALNSTQLTQTNSVMGSVHYLPPEQAAGKGSTIRSDIYSMGILMYELLTGQVPYKGDNAVEIALKHLKEPLPSIRKILPELPQSIENIILKATAKNPQNRYKDAREMHQDIITALDESRINEPKLVYKYKENDLEETKSLDEAVEVIKKQEKESMEKMKKQELEETKSEKKILIIFASIFTGLIVLAAVIVFLLPHISKGKTLSVPDVSKLSKVEATNKLVKQGFTVSCGEEDYKYDSSDTIEEGYAIKTSPEAGTMVKEGKTICIIISSGENTFQLEDYTGMNYFEVKGILDTKCKDLCNVIIEKEKVKETDTYEDNTVIKTSPEKGTTIKKGDTIKLFIPDKEVLYPDFTTYTVEQVDEFAKKYNLTVEKKYVENSLLPPGTITGQSRSKGTVVTSPGEFSITITKTPDVVEDIILPDEE
jgi:serine/threonine protein kinase